jgi:glycosyltransferase involved in cell wall biosynthesis
MHHLPEFYTRHERVTRERDFRQAGDTATLLLVTSEFARRDLERFAPEYSSKTRVLHWVPNLPAEVYAVNPYEVVERYHLPDKFFYLPNQFWKHKNHKTVIYALVRLRDRGLYPNIVCTGQMHGPSDPSYLPALMREISESQLRDQFIILGTVPRRDVFSLIRQSVAVLNPTLFEGFGLSVAESKAVGKRVLAADLPAHKEQDAPAAEYFDPKNVDELTEKLGRIWQESEPGPELDLEENARRVHPAAQRRFAQGFLEIATEAIDRHAQLPSRVIRASPR